MITSIFPRYCSNCKVSLDPETHNQLCSLCWAILESLATPYWHSLHREWVRENMSRMVAKDRLLNLEQEESDDTQA